MTMPIDLHDPRTARAVAIAATAGQWLKCTTPDGRKAYGIRSCRDTNRVYLVTPTSCTCKDWQRNGNRPERLGEAGLHLNCKHVQAVRIHVSLVRFSEQAPSEARHLADEQLFWQRRTAAATSRVTDATRMLAQRYDDIFKRFEGE